MTRIRVLTADDAAAFSHLRQEALEREPFAFGSSVEEHRVTPPEAIAERFRSEARRGNFVLGAFADGQLVGTAGFRREDRAKTAHKGWIWGVYVTGHSRCKGIGRALLQELLVRARALPGLEQIQLCVAVDGPAQHFYRSLGFESFGIEKQSLKVLEEYVDQSHMVLRLGER